MEEFYSFAMILSIATFTLSTVTTPGPNNIMLLSSGLTFGYKKTIPHMSGIAIGFPFMVILVGLGMGVVFQKFPIVLTILKVVGILYLFWMAYKIANNKNSYDIETKKKSKPFTFFQSAMFQWVNPKAWIMATTSVSVFVSSNYDNFTQVLVIALLYFLSAIFSTNFWAFGGVVLKKIIKNETYLRFLNIAMAILLIGSVLPVLF